MDSLDTYLDWPLGETSLEKTLKVAGALGFDATATMCQEEPVAARPEAEKRSRVGRLHRNGP